MGHRVGDDCRWFDDVSRLYCLGVRNGHMKGTRLALVSFWRGSGMCKKNNHLPLDGCYFKPSQLMLESIKGKPNVGA